MQRNTPPGESFSIEYGSLSNLEERTFDSGVYMVYLYRFFNNAGKCAIYARDFSSTIGAFMNTFGSGDITVSGSGAGNDIKVKNNINGMVSYIAFKQDNE